MRTYCLYTLISLFCLSASIAGFGNDEKPVSVQIFLLKNELPTNVDLFTTLKQEWQMVAKNVSVENSQITFTLDDGKVELNLHSAPMPETEWAAFAQIAWLWKTAANDIKGHKAYLDVKFTPNISKSAYQSELALAKINATLLHVLPNSALGVLVADRYLLLDRNYYRETMKNLPAGEAPAYLMIYFGMATEENKNSGFTYGLHRFNLPEVEIIQSNRSIHEVHGILYQSVANLIARGQLSLDADQKSSPGAVAVSSGVFVTGQTMKIKF
jgi:hypothetical protein